jgi:arginase
VSARVIVEVPSHLGLRAAGVEGLPEALLAAGFAERVGARRGTRLAPPPSTRRSTPTPAC